MKQPVDPIVLYMCEIEQFGGAERSLLALSRWLHRRKLSHYLLTYHDHCNIAKYADHPLNVTALNPAGGAWNKIQALRRHCKEHRVIGSRLLGNGYQPALHATLAGVRGFHNLMHDTPSLFGDALTRSLKTKLRLALSSSIVGYGSRSGGKTIVTSEYLKGECLKDFGVSSYIVRMGGFSPSKPAPYVSPASRPPRRFNLLSVCRVEENKRIDWILRSLALISRSAIAPLDSPLNALADWHLDIVGKGQLISSLQALSLSLGISEYVTFHGFVPDADLEVFYNKADLSLTPAVQGYGIPAIEALRRSVPVLLHRESGVSDILLDTPWATVLSGGPDDLTPALAQAIHGVLCGRQIGVSPPRIPTEEEWAEGVAKLCGWA